MVELFLFIFVIECVRCGCKIFIVIEIVYKC